MNSEVSNEKTYGVIVNFLPKNIQIHYEILVKQVDDYVELRKRKTYVNNQSITKLAEQLVEKLEQVLYPLCIVRNENGSIYEIRNCDQIYKRWQEEHLPQLKEYYQSDYAEQIFNRAESIFKNINTKNELLNKSIFFRLFFLPVYQNYVDYTKEDSLKIHFSSLERDINYNVKFKLDENYTKGQKIMLNITGLEKINLTNPNERQGNCDIKYKFDMQSTDIFSIIGSFTTFDENIEHKIDFQLYELRN